MTMLKKTVVVKCKDILIFKQILNTNNKFVHVQ